MKNKVLTFIIFLISFMAFTPTHALPDEVEIERFQENFFLQIVQAEATLTQRYYDNKCVSVFGINGPTAVVGDLHGDLFTFREIRRQLSQDLRRGDIQNVVFLGDIMDRGENSAKTLTELLEFFNEFPGCVYILRGNHETMSMFDNFSGDSNPARNDPYFRGIDSKIFENFFDKLPYAVIINGHTLAVHGGIPQRDLWDDFYGRGWYRENGFGFDAVYSAMWADYSPYGDVLTINKSRTLFDDRIISYSEKNVVDFFKYTGGKQLTHGLKYLIRAHQPSLGSTFHQSPNKIVTTVFSAIENQNEEFEIEGASVGFVSECCEPSERYFAVYPYGGQGRTCVYFPLSTAETETESESDNEFFVELDVDSDERSRIRRSRFSVDPREFKVEVDDDDLKRSECSSSFEGVDILRSSVSQPETEYSYNPNDESECAFYDESFESDSDSDYEFGHIDIKTRNFVSHKDDRSASDRSALEQSQRSYTRNSSQRGRPYTFMTSNPEVSLRPIEGSENSSWTPAPGYLGSSSKPSPTAAGNTGTYRDTKHSISFWRL